MAAATTSRSFSRAFRRNSCRSASGPRTTSRRSASSADEAERAQTMAKLVARLPDGTLREIKLDRDRITIGRRVDNDFCLAYPAVSADHAEIITVIGDSFLNDLGSTNGTLVNGQRVVKHFLRDHDEIDLGRIQLVYLANEDETVEPLQVQPAEEGKASPAPEPVASESSAAS